MAQTVLPDLFNISLSLNDGNCGRIPRSSNQSYYRSRPMMCSQSNNYVSNYYIGRQLRSNGTNGRHRYHGRDHRSMTHTMEKDHRGLKDYSSTPNGRQRSSKNNMRGNSMRTSMSSNHANSNHSNRRSKKRHGKTNKAAFDKQRKSKSSASRNYQNAQRKRYGHPMRCSHDDPTPHYSTPGHLVGLYLDSQRILLVGDGDFSFARSLAEGFAPSGGDTAPNLTATSLDKREMIESTYQNAKAAFQSLEKRKCKLFFSVDATKLGDVFAREKFDRIVYNFPHVGWGINPGQLHVAEWDKQQIERNTQLVCSFLRSATPLLLPNGEVHITHKTSYPYNEWDISSCASGTLLRLTGTVPFCPECYTGYQCRRGWGESADESFPIEDGVTFIFRLKISPINASHRRGI